MRYQEGEERMFFCRGKRIETFERVLVVLIPYGG
jgi:hypothetical protein